MCEARTQLSANANISLELITKRLPRATGSQSPTIIIGTVTRASDSNFLFEISSDSPRIYLFVNRKSYIYIIKLINGNDYENLLRPSKDWTIVWKM